MIFRLRVSDYWFLCTVYKIFDIQSENSQLGSQTSLISSTPNVNSKLQAKSNHLLEMRCYHLPPFNALLNGFTGNWCLNAFSQDVREHKYRRQVGLKTLDKAPEETEKKPA